MVNILSGLLKPMTGSTGHWEGDLIIGKNQASQIGTLVERSHRVRPAATFPTAAPPGNRRRRHDRHHKEPARCSAPHCDLGPRASMTSTHHISIDDINIFCDPHSPWQRGSNENTNGLLNTFRKARTYPCTPRPTSPTSRTQRTAPQTIAAGAAPPTCSDSYYRPQQKPLLQPSLDAKRVTSTLASISTAETPIRYDKCARTVSTN